MESHYRVGQATRGGVRVVLDLPPPPQCLAYGAAVDRTEGLRTERWNRTAFIELPLCNRYGLSFEIDEGKEVLSGLVLMLRPISMERASHCAMKGAAIWCWASSSRIILAPPPRSPAGWPAPVPPRRDRAGCVPSPDALFRTRLGSTRAADRLYYESRRSRLGLCARIYATRGPLILAC